MVRYTVTCRQSGSEFYIFLVLRGGIFKKFYFRYMRSKNICQNEFCSGDYFFCSYVFAVSKSGHAIKFKDQKSNMLSDKNLFIMCAGQTIV